MNALLKLALLPFVILALLALPAGPARAEPITYGYLWSLEFDFESSYTGVLTIQVGPWQNGNLVSVDKTSKAPVRCLPVGAVALNGGDAVFSGGYLRCKLDLATVVQQNHGLEVAATDSYGSMLFVTTLQSTAPVVAPIFTHPDAAYTVDFTQSSAVTLAQTLNNTAGLQQAHFPGVIGASWNKYIFEYGCAWLGPCSGDLSVGPFTQATPPGGKRISFATGPTTFLIGGDGVTTFQGRMGHLLIDPGNSVH